MTDKEQKKAAKEFAAFWKDKGSEKSEKQTYWDYLLKEVYGAESLTKLVQYEKSVIIDGNQKSIDVYIHHEDVNIIVEQKKLGKDLNKRERQSDGQMLNAFEQAKRYNDNLDKPEQADYIITCNFSEFNIYDMNHKKNPPVKIMLNNLPKEYHLMNFLVGSKSERIKKEEKISTDAGEIVRKLRNALKKQYVDDENDVNLNKLCVRLVFCFYAEDANVFDRGKFHDYLKDIPVNKWHRELEDLFRVLNTKTDKRNKYDDPKLNDFPYVNGGLFEEEIVIPNITDEIADIILNTACDFDWSEISPTIFGAVFESTMNPEARRDGGLHFTSIENIHKVIDPLFLDELKDEFNEIKAVVKTKNHISKMTLLDNFHKKISSLIFLDPACGSGNFLTESYLSLRKLENELIEIENSLISGQLMINNSCDLIQVNINQFYGIEINDFAVAVAKTALWIAEIQMLQQTQELLPDHDFPILPLETNYNIHEKNALRIDWNEVVSKDKLNYIMGNPPFKYGELSDSQKEDRDNIFDGKGGELDYVACWYKKAADYIGCRDIKCAFVSTNSICQGQQVYPLWNTILNSGIRIDFAYRTFIWDSESDDPASVYCVIIGFSRTGKGKRKLFDNGVMTYVDNINGYLIDAPNTYVEKRSVPFSKVPEVIYGFKPADHGYLILDDKEKATLIKKEPDSAKWIRPFITAKEYIHGINRWCLWLVGISPHELNQLKSIKKRVESCRIWRSEQKKTGDAYKLRDIPHLMRPCSKFVEGDFIVLPLHTGENRKYIPIGFAENGCIPGNSVSIVPNATMYHFGILCSSVHMAWTKTVCGRLEMRYRYSSDIVYNTFPWCSPTKEQQQKIEQTAQAILDVRALYPDSSLADFYDKGSIAIDLKKAHEANDKAVMEAYGFDKDMPDSEIVAALMKMYQKLTAKE